MSDSASANPKQDWTAQVYLYEVDPIAEEFLDQLSEDAQSGVHTTGHAMVTAALVSIGAKTAVIKGCVDTTKQDIVDAAGHSIKAANHKGSYWRYAEIATLTMTDKGWRLSGLDSQFDHAC